MITNMAWLWVTTIEYSGLGAQAIRGGNNVFLRAGGGREMIGEHWESFHQVMHLSEGRHLGMYLATPNFNFQ